MSSNNKNQHPAQQEVGTQGESSYLPSSRHSTTARHHRRHHHHEHQSKDRHDHLAQDISHKQNNQSYVTPNTSSINAVESGTHGAMGNQPDSNQRLSLGGYYIDRPIGRGTFAVVHLGQHINTGSLVAVKIIHKSKMFEKSGGTEDEARLHREVTIMRTLSNHPHIVRIYELQDTATDLFLFNEYCGGGELFDYICKKRRLSETESRSFFQQLICALCYSHSHSIVHRDLKPENIMLNEKRVLKLCDFGLSNFNEYGQFLKTFCGSPNYAAPEIVSGKPYVAPEVDVWSCGVILYAMLCGYLPFDDPSLSVLFDKIRSGSFKVPAFLTQSVQELIKKMIVVDPFERLTLREVRRHSWFDTSLPQQMKIYFFYGPLPPLSSLVTRKHLLRRYGIPEYTNDELRTMFEIDTHDDGLHCMKQRTYDNLAKFLVLSTEHLGGQMNANASCDTILGGPRPIEAQPNRNYHLRSLTINEDDEEAREMLDPPPGIEDLDTEVIHELARLGYDMSDPVQVIDSVLRPDIYPTPETVAYHLLMDARKGETRMPLQTACYIGIAHMCINRHGLPGDIVSKRQLSIIKARSDAYIEMELANLAFEQTERGNYEITSEILAKLAPPHINDPSQRGQSDTVLENVSVIGKCEIQENESAKAVENQPSNNINRSRDHFLKSKPPNLSQLNDFKLLPIVRMIPQDWNKQPLAFPKEIQRKAAACAVFRNDLHEPSIDLICPSFKFTLPTLKRRPKNTKIPAKPIEDKYTLSLTRKSLCLSTPDAPVEQGPFPIWNRRSRLASFQKDGRDSNNSFSERIGFTQSPGVIMQELLKIIARANYVWKKVGYGKWICRKQIHVNTVEEELSKLRANITASRLNDAASDIYGEMSFMEEYNTMPSDGYIVLLVQILSLGENGPVQSIEYGNVRHFVDVLQMNGPVTGGLCEANEWITKLQKVMAQKDSRDLEGERDTNQGGGVSIQD